MYLMMTFFLTEYWDFLVSKAFHKPWSDDIRFTAKIDVYEFKLDVVDMQ